MVNDKKEYIEDLQLSSLLSLYLSLLQNLKFESVTQAGDNCIDVKVIVPNAGTYLNSYIFFTDILSRNYNGIQDLVELVDKKLASGYSKIFIVSNRTISNGFRQNLEHKVFNKNSIVFVEIDDIIESVENSYQEYWRHADQSLISYEKEFEIKLVESFQIKKLIEYKAAYQKLISIFIEPNLFLRTADKQSTKKAFTKISLDRTVDENEGLLLLHGDPGVGKTRVLNEIGKKLIERNTKISGKRYLPVFIDTLNLRESFIINEELNLCELILNNKLNGYFQNSGFSEITDEYQLVLLVDSIDEFEKNYKKKIFSQLETLLDSGVLIFLGTRSNTITEIFKKPNKNFKDVYIHKFNDAQVEKFATRYFEGNGNVAQGLIESLKENRILEKLPVTPLNLSLMSILYEETNQYELPATLNDIYDKFTNLLLGRTMADKSIDFLDITVKENILGIYALELLQRKNSELLTKEEFFIFFEDKLKSISGTIDMSLLPKALDYIIEHTGLLVLQRGKYVKFRHDSYMEYFAAKEIFKNHRELEDDLVKNFFDVNWQFAAVFYGGESRKMPIFLKKIIEKVKSSRTMQEHWLAANGTGYLLQALYLTDDSIRKDAVLEVLKLMVDTYEGFKKISGSNSEHTMIGKLPLPILSIFPIFLFQDNFDSITLKNPLTQALDDLLELYDEKKSIKNYPYIDNIIYQILILSIAISSNRLGLEDKLSEVISRLNATGNDFYTKLLETAIDNLGSSELRKQKNEILNPKKIRAYEGSKFLSNKALDIYLQPANRHRFSIYDKITPNKRVKIFVEGPSDAIILEHAYSVLTGYIPYWEIKVGDIGNGGANGLAKALNEGLAYLDSDQMVIGIFDNDAKGIQEFKGALRDNKFDYLDGERIKKRKEGSIYGMLLPIPHELQHYIQERETDNYFSIEHYLPENFLKQNDVLANTSIPNIYSIKDSKKMSFAKTMAQSNNITLFKNFIPLFKEIDTLSGMTEEINYKEE